MLQPLTASTTQVASTSRHSRSDSRTKPAPGAPKPALASSAEAARHGRTCTATWLGGTLKTWLTSCSRCASVAAKRRSAPAALLPASRACSHPTGSM
nr:hypothetical protein [Variovorax sp. TBS-050B]